MTHGVLDALQLNRAVIESFRPKRERLWTFEAYEIPAEDLVGWCIQYKVFAYGYAGQPIPEDILREHLDCAVQYHGIWGRYWDKIGGLGDRYGAPGKPLPLSPGERVALAEDEHEDHESRQRFYANNPDEDHAQEWGWS